MKKSDIRDITIRTDEARAMDTNSKAGIDSVSGVDVGAPETMGNPSGAPSGGTPVTIPSVAGLPVGPGGSGSGREQPACVAPSDADSVQTSPSGRSVSWPDAADRTSAGGAGSTTTLVQKTGSAVKFPEAADTSMQPKSVDSFAC